MQELRKLLEQLLEQVKSAASALNVADQASHLKQLHQQAASPDFWNDSSSATEVTKQIAELTKQVDFWTDLEKNITETLELASSDDGSLEGEIRSEYERYLEMYKRREFELQLSGPHDRGSAIIEISAGAGGTDAQDWASMLLRMYLRFAERTGLTAQVLSISEGEEAGIKSATVEIDGANAYGLLRSEKGVHRLVRLSPFNSDNLRQTSFAMVEVLPKLDRTDLVIDPKDLRIDVYRSGGHGGQSVNTTDSAVRITHLPTGLVVAIQNERSQLQNREKAMAILASRLQMLMEQQHKAELSELRGVNQSAEWGSQIRSYVLHPYTKVKDHRTGAETSQAQDVLDGDLDPFIQAYLKSRIGQ